MYCPDIIGGYKQTNDSAGKQEIIRDLQAAASPSKPIRVKCSISVGPDDTLGGPCATYPCRKVPAKSIIWLSSVMVFQLNRDQCHIFLHHSLLQEPHLWLDCLGALQYPVETLVHTNPTFMATSDNKVSPCPWW